MQHITKISDTSFSMVWDEVPNEKLTINFKNVIEQHNLKGKYCLLHWQAKPKGYRKWGIYSSLLQEYYSIKANEVRFNTVGRLIEVDENNYSEVPTAVVLFSNSVLVLPNNVIKYYSVNNG